MSFVRFESAGTVKECQACWREDQVKVYSPSRVEYNLEFLDEFGCLNASIGFEGRGTILARIVDGTERRLGRFILSSSSPAGYPLTDSVMEDELIEAAE